MGLSSTHEIGPGLRGGDPVADSHKTGYQVKTDRQDSATAGIPGLDCGEWRLRKFKFLLEEGVLCHAENKG